MKELEVNINGDDTIDVVVDGKLVPNCKVTVRTCEEGERNRRLDNLLSDLMERLDEEFNPHTTAIVTPASAEIVQGVRSVINENLRD
jgi:hypothetical protein